MKLTITDESLTMCEIEKKVLIEDSETHHWKSNFPFLSQHYGFRNGMVHLFIGTTGSGKSTLTRTLVCDLLSNLNENRRGGLWLSEETVTQFKVEFSRSGYEKQTDFFHITSELTQEVGDYISSEEKFLNAVDAFIRKFNLKILFIDNITTSKIYGNSIGIASQNNIATGLKKIASKHGIPLVIIAHTNANISDSYDKIISSKDIRGSKYIGNISEFIYILQRVVTNDKIIPYLLIDKCRTVSMKNHFFELGYVPRRRIFAIAHPASFDQFKEHFKQRNRL